MKQITIIILLTCPYLLGQGNTIPKAIDSVRVEWGGQVTPPDSIIYTSELGDTANSIRGALTEIEIGDLENVSAITPNTGDILIYNAITGFWNAQANEFDLSPELVVTPAESKIVMDVDSVRTAGNLEVGDTLKVPIVGNASDLEFYAKNLQINLTDSTSKYFLTIADENAGNNIVTNGTFDNDLSGWDATGTPLTFEWVASGGGFTGAAHLVTNEDYEDIHISPTIISTPATGQYRIKMDINIVSITGSAELVRYLSVSPMINSDEYEMFTTGLYSIDTVLIKPTNSSTMFIDIAAYQLGVGTVEFYVDNILVQPLFGTSLSIIPEDGINIESLDNITIRTDEILNLYGTVLVNGLPLSTGGSVGNADSLGGIPAIQYALDNDVDSILKVSGGTYKLSYSGLDINGWLSGIDSWTTGLDGNSNVLRLGKSYADRRFNNGAYSDVWIIDYVVPPYNLSASWLFPIEHRTDYYNDTLNTIANVANILNIDGTGTPIWLAGGVNITGNEIQMNVGDLPDSAGQTWANNYLAGSRVILSEANKTATPSRFSLPVKGYEFKFGSTPNYTYPYVYGFYSDLTTNSPNLEIAYHFYGTGDYPSYFGGDLQVDGSITSGIVITYPDANTIYFGGDAIQLDPATLEMQAGKLTVVGGIDTLIFNNLFNTAIDTMASDTLDFTATQINNLLDNLINMGIDSTAVSSGEFYFRASDGILRRKY